ncbi:sugar transferase [Paracoccus alkenifer]|uniref:Sugar transferase involved in LPS biosynthesis (Colanic, teichoic acid) n=1 Tax=Paracoccus alkenifer TaxID=65735 RepID=A0A1H6MGR1_9RHOB|nr:sugar transferase [Paracoccus alkenifer]SEH97509.1 Sugar transferase involved in LPS biosynthesis (colanic, teichoic acid) [Paracoccus alkenifer]
MTIHHDWHADAGLVPIRTARLQGPTGKRLFDVALALALLLPLSAVMLGVAGVLLLAQGRPVFYLSERMRAPGQVFRLIKFRTMIPVDSDSGATGGHKSWRISRLGRILRRSRCDELPQIFNILAGDMSFVGPRPPLREYVERFPVRYGQVMQMRPGVTGLATLICHAHEDRILARCLSPAATESAYYRRCLPMKLRLDMVYLRRRTLWLDLWIIANTVATVIRPGWKHRRRRGLAGNPRPPDTARAAG